MDFRTGVFVKKIVKGVIWKFSDDVAYEGMDEGLSSSCNSSKIEGDAATGAEGRDDDFFAKLFCNVFVFAKFASFVLHDDGIHITPLLDKIRFPYRFSSLLLYG